MEILEMDTDTASTFSPKDKVAILLEEYKTLRTEIIQYNTSGFGLIGIGGTATVAISATLAANNPRLGFALFVVLAMAITALYRHMRFALLEFAAQLIELERMINHFAGEKLLSWETERGGVSPKMRRRRFRYMFFPFARPANPATKPDAERSRN